MKKSPAHLKSKSLKLILVLLLLCLGIPVFRTIRSDLGLNESYTYFASNSAGGLADLSQDWNLVLVNANYYIPDDFEVELTELSNGRKVDKRIYPDLQNMFDDARASGLSLYVREGYRTAAEQQEILDERIQRYRLHGYSRKKAEKLATEYVALPGTSEHQLGLSVDINAAGDCSSDDVYKWLDDNAYLYGFIKRYPADKTEITGINNEPWHYRYVGYEASCIMKEQNLCLEEYLGMQK